MPIKLINVGAAANDKTGAPLRDAFVVANENFSALDSEKEPKITPGTNAQYLRGDKTWQPTAGLPVGDATISALALKADTTAVDAALGAKADKTAVAAAIAMAATFTSVPTTHQGAMVVVTAPHLRFMIWNGTKYVRAPWHRPCDLFFSYDNPATIPGALQVRADATYQQANYPDVVERLGLSGTGTFTLVEARGESLRVLDNGRGVDAGRAIRSWQDGQVQVHHHTLATSISGSSGHVKSASGGSLHNDANLLQFMGTDVAQSYQLYAASAGGSESRVRNVAFPLWMTY